MKKYILMFAVTGIFAFSSCDNTNNRGVDNNRDRQDTVNVGGPADRGVGVDRDMNNMGNDTTMRRGIGEGQTGQSQTGRTGQTNDSREQTGQSVTGAINVPRQIQDAIRNDNTLSQRNIRNSRTFTRDGRTYYELTFEGDTTRIVFDEQGNRQRGNNR
jgi:hypothetical protein